MQLTFVSIETPTSPVAFTAIEPPRSVLLAVAFSPGRSIGADQVEPAFNETSRFSAMGGLVE